MFNIPDYARYTTTAIAASTFWALLAYMLCDVCVTVWCLSICLSVCPIMGRGAADTSSCLQLGSCSTGPQHGAQQQMPYIQSRFVSKKSTVFPYSLPSVGPGADPGVQAVSPQVTSSESRHRPGSRLPLLSARPAVTSVAFTRWRYL